MKSSLETNFSLSKRDLTLPLEELWKPLVFVQTKSVLLLSIKKVFDIQAASIFRDLNNVLPSISGNVIDVGCGLQPYRNIFSSNVNYIGLDIIDSSEKFGLSLEGVLAIKKDGTFPILDNSIDFALATEVLEHVQEPQKLLKEVHRCLNAKGKVCFTTPFTVKWHLIPFDYWRFTPSSLKIIFEEAGFNNIKVYARGNPLTVVCYKFCLLILCWITQQKRKFIGFKIFKYMVGFLLSPLILIFCLIGMFSLNFDWGDDCLGYTILAEVDKKI